MQLCNYVDKLCMPDLEIITNEGIIFPRNDLLPLSLENQYCSCSMSIMEILTLTAPLHRSYLTVPSEEAVNNSLLSGVHDMSYTIPK